MLTYELLMCRFKVFVYCKYVSSNGTLNIEQKALGSFFLVKVFLGSTVLRHQKIACGVPQPGMHGISRASLVNVYPSLTAINFFQPFVGRKICEKGYVFQRLTLHYTQGC